MAGVDLDVPTAECGYCLQKGDILVDPRELPCNHIHCMTCLKAHYDLRSVVQCAQPACRKVFDVRLDTLPAASSTCRNKYTCDICVKKAIERKAVVYCTTCCQKYCTQHQQSHDDFHEHHPKVGIEKYKTEATKLEVRTCIKHTDLPYIRGCKTCLALLCVECVCEPDSCTDGSTHQLVQIDELVLLLTRQIHNLTAKLIDKEGQLADISKYASTVLSDYEVATLDMIETLHTARDEQLEAIKEKYNQLEVQLIEERNATHTEISGFIEGVINVDLLDFHKHRLRTEARLKNSHQVDVVNEHMETSNEIQRMVEKRLPNLPCNGVKLIKQAECRSLEVKIVDTSDVRIHKHSSIQKLPVPTALRMKHQSAEINEIYSIYSHEGVTYIGSKDTIYLVDEMNDSVTSINTTLNGYIEGICVYNNRLYVLVDDDFYSCYRIHVLELDGTTITSWEHSDESRVFRSSLVVIADQVLVPDRSNDSLKVYSLEGEDIKDFECPVLSSDSAVFMCAVDNESVVISSTKTSTVCRVDINTGETMWSFTHMINPGGVACFNEEFLLVVPETSENTEVFILDITTGECLDKLVDSMESSTFDLDAVCATGNTFIASIYDKKIVVYYELMSEEAE